MIIDICTRVKLVVGEYWLLHPLMRVHVYGWLNDHVMECDACALALENEAQRLQKENRK